MSPREFVAFETRSIRGYADFQVAAGLWPRRDAGLRAAGLIRRLLPQGLQTPRHHCWTIRDRRTAVAVGHLWVAEVDASGVNEGYIYDIEIDADHRRQGYGEAALRALVAWARRKRMSAIRLRVHAHNAAARSLYERFGFAATDVMMALPLPVRRRSDR